MGIPSIHDVATRHIDTPRRVEGSRRWGLQVQLTQEMEAKPHNSGIGTARRGL